MLTCVDYKDPPLCLACTKQIITNDVCVVSNVSTKTQRFHLCSTCKLIETRAIDYMRKRYSEEAYEQYRKLMFEGFSARQKLYESTGELDKKIELSDIISNGIIKAC